MNNSTSFARFFSTAAASTTRCGSTFSSSSSFWNKYKYHYSSSNGKFFYPRGVVGKNSSHFNFHRFRHQFFTSSSLLSSSSSTSLSSSSDPKNPAVGQIILNGKTPPLVAPATLADDNNSNNENKNNINDDINQYNYNYNHNNDAQGNHSTAAAATAVTTNSKSDKLRGILKDIGMSISQWKIQDERGNGTSPPLGDNRRARRKRSFRQSDHLAPENVNPYVHRHMPSSIISSRLENDVDGHHHLYSYYSSSHGHGTRRRRTQPLSEEDISARLRVKSVYAASNINITKVLTSVFGPASKTPALRHTFGKTNIIIQLPSVAASVGLEQSQSQVKSQVQSQVQSQSLTTASGEEIVEGEVASYSESQPRFVAIFRFGSIVFFNVSTADSTYILEAVKKHSTDPVPRGFERKEHFEIAISPQMEDTAYVNADFATVKELNINNVAIVSTIMGQTVAFDSYNDTVDELLATFASINSNVKKTGNFTAMERETLFKVVAQNNSLFIDMIAKLGIKDRSDTAW
eukprot:CAMPEP_0176479656 /NCGR_PEP_ID=MMETSP0200_2-20121128/1857_1 /TAXON_ID=947934 /ORGANISM="Chaetoceros sp., Strain GSL56" /LENGTH=517 /DNA_ID=CAMNT_0017875717 /DNA_START=13 /DNA_END=1563 /DNA_ORIENTATION=-